jgi:hypothetical protein
LRTNYIARVIEMNKIIEKIDVAFVIEGVGHIGSVLQPFVQMKGTYGMLFGLLKKYCNCKIISLGLILYNLKSVGGIVHIGR